ncbi:MAG: DUF2806 domain-containing protein [Phycisphaerales bacterium]|nr:DUF2806 domain-containing protein [Phycisphaerales bacterium]
MTWTNATEIVKAASEPICKLIETVGAFVGEAYQPRLMVRSARAEVESAIIRAEGQEKLTKIQQRTLERLFRTETRRQHNIERIVDEAASSIPDDVSQTPVSEDWIVRFFEGCQDVSEAEMQALWGRILSGEVTQPGSFSPYTLDILRLIRKREAEMFTLFCTLVWQINGQPTVLFPRKSEYSKRYAPLQNLNHLESLGLLRFESEFMQYSFTCPGPAALLSYFGRKCVLKAAKEPIKLEIGSVLLSPSGIELFRVVTPISDAKCYDEVVESLGKADFEIYPVTAEVTHAPNAR